MRAIRGMAIVVLGIALVMSGGHAARAQAPGAGQVPGTSQPAAPAPAAPQSQDAGDSASEIALTRAVIQVQRQAIVTMAMDLDEKEARAFWPLYREYRLAMGKVGDRLVNVITTYADNYPDISDEMASKLLNEYLAIEKARTSVKSKYVPRFRKILPARKVARFFQVDNKLDAAINAELAEQVPLVR